MERRLNISLGKNATVFQVEVYAILVCVHEIQMNEYRALKALQAAKTKSPFV